jgi:predicted AlkP superfamily phosphohydrolase/phosphomutase
LLPEEHGITDGWGRPLRGSKTFDTCEAKYVWDVLVEEGFTVGLFNLPVTYPPRPIPRVVSSNNSATDKEPAAFKNWMVSGFPAPDTARHAITWPQSLQSELVAEGDLVKRYFSDPIQFFTCKILGQDDAVMGAWYNVALDSGEEMVSEVVETVSRHQLQVCLRLFKNHPPDVGFCQFSFLDRIGHLFCFSDSNEERTNRWYGLVDEFVGKLIEQEKPDNVLIVSDHGFQDDHHLQNGTIVMSGQVFGAQQQITMKIQQVTTMIKKCLGLESSTTVDDEIASQLRALGYIE